MKPLIQALTRAKKKFEPFRKNGTIKGKNGTWQYALLEDINAAIDDALTEEGIHCYHTYDYETVFGMPMLVTTCWLTDGEFTKPPTSVKLPMASAFDALNPPQATGSLLSYGRRYSLIAAMGLAADVDDDAQSVDRDPEKQKEQRAPAEVTRIAPRQESRNPAMSPVEKRRYEWMTQQFESYGLTQKDRDRIIGEAAGKDMQQIAAEIAACACTTPGQRA